MMETVASSDVGIWWVRHHTAHPSWLTAGTTPAERDQATRFETLEGRSRFLAGRALVRTVVAHVCGVDPELLIFDRHCRYCGDPHHGKPILVGAAALRWSLSRSDDLCAVALRPDGDIGFDIVSLAATPPLGSPAEWAAIEATLKLSGRGLADDPRLVQLSPSSATAPGQPEVSLTTVPLPDTIGVVAMDAPATVVVREVAGTSGVLC